MSREIMISEDAWERWDALKAAWIDDRAPIRSKCKHEWVLLYRGEGVMRHRFVACAICEMRPHCAQSIFDSRRRQNHTHAQGESEREATAKARFATAMGNPCESYRCRHCGFWSIT